ncbi:MAG TPA: radical SAM protein [Vicinamibacterales bacterium]|nr:radical SAM protein [Vicinamibacterales bacterium]
MRCLSIHLTDLCNSKCSFCVVGSPLYTTDSIDEHDVTQFLRDHAGQGYEAVNLHGGEATIHPRFVEILELIRSSGYPEVHLQTNGISLARPEFARRTVDLGVRLFIISLHGDSAGIQDPQTGTPGGFARTVQGIKNVKALGARVRTNTVVTRTNVGHLPGIAALAVDAGVDHINFSNLHPVGSAIFGLSRLVPAFDEIRRFLYPAIETSLAAGRRVTLEGFPYCTVREYAGLHLNNEYRDIRMLYRGRVIDSYDDFMNDVMRAYGDPCASCTVREACGGVYKQYTDLRGWAEFEPILMAPASGGVEAGQMCERAD